MVLVSKLITWRTQWTAPSKPDVHLAVTEDAVLNCINSFPDYSIIGHPVYA